jgi:hypothetical protein
MRLRAGLAVLALLLAGGCVSFSSSNPNPPPPSTVVVPAR